jgi:hypothetical protein
MVSGKGASAVRELLLKAQGLIKFLIANKNEDVLRVKRIMKHDLPAALKAFRADMGLYPLPNNDGFCNLAALNDKSMVPSFLQPRWKGPYINLKVSSWDLNENNILVDAENGDIRFGVMVVPSYHFRDMTAIKKGTAANKAGSRYCSIVALLPRDIAACLKFELGASLALYEWDDSLSMVFYAIAPMQSFMHC